MTVSFTSCNGQIKTDLSKDNEPKTITTRQSKLVKTQGTNEYANVHCGLQDKAGNLWFGTTGEGVYRYDGAFFTQFTVKDGLSSNDVFSILEDRTGNIWFGTGDGVCRYDGKKITSVSMNASSNNFYLSNPTNDIASAKNSVHSMMQDRSGKIWLASSKGVYCYNFTLFHPFLYNEKIINEAKLNLKSTKTILEDKNGNIWFTTWFEGICRYDGKSIISFKPNSEEWFATILEDKNRNIWAGRRYKGVCRYDGNEFTNVLQYGIFDLATVRPLAEDKSGVWFGTENEGVWCYNGNSFKNFTMKDGLSNNSVFCIVPDAEGNIWVGTRNIGLCRYDGKTFTSFSE